MAYLTNNSGDPDPVIVWYTDHPDNLQITPGSGNLSATLTALAPSPTQTPYDIKVFAVVDNVQTNNLPVYIDTPYYINTLGPVDWPGGCPTEKPAEPFGWWTTVTNSVLDWTGILVLSKIDLNETIENFKFLQNPTTWNFGAPVAGAWPVAYWSNNTFIDNLSLCASTLDGWVPAITAYNTGNTTPGASDTQKFWVGTTMHFAGECVAIDDTQFNSGFPTQTPWIGPGPTPTQQQLCAQGNSWLNN